MLGKTSVSEKELSDKNFVILKMHCVLKINLIDSADNMHLTVDSLIDINNMITGSSNIILTKVYVKPCGKI